MDPSPLTEASSLVGHHQRGSFFVLGLGHSPGQDLGPDRGEGQPKAEEYADEAENAAALEAVAQAKRRRGYRDL